MGRRRDFYERLRKKIDAKASKLSERYGSKVTGWLLLLPDLFALCARLLLDERVSRRSKVVLGVSVAYVISPIDLVPEALLGPFGLVDDLAILCLALQKVKKSTEEEEILSEYWSGDEDIAALVDEVVEKVGTFVDQKIVKKLKRRLEG